MSRIFKEVAFWFSYFSGMVMLVLAVGTGLFAEAFLLFGRFFIDATMQELIQKGAWVGFRYAGVWAGGVAIVLCFLQGKKRYGKKKAQ